MKYAYNNNVAEVANENSVELLLFQRKERKGIIEYNENVYSVAEVCLFPWKQTRTFPLKEFVIINYLYNQMPG